jgi:hypothetical protein
MQEEADKNDAALTISGILTLATDNAKELILSKLNATSALVDIYTYLTSLGVDTKTISDIMIPGSFTYIAKLQEGDLFNNFTRNITIDNAIKFYLGKYHFGINPKVLRGLFNVGKNWELTKATLDSEKVQKAIDLCLEAIKIKKNKEAEMREYLRNAAENGVDPSEEMESGNEGYVEPEVELGENGKPIEPPIPITALSTPEIYQVIEFLKECLERNENRKLYANKEVDANLTLLLTAVLPGVREQSMMGKMAGINQGLKTKAFDKLAFKQNIENYITGQYENYIRNSKISFEKEREIIIKELNKRNVDPETRQKLNEDLDWYNKEISRLELILKNLPTFDLYEFLTNDRIQQ